MIFFTEIVNAQPYFTAAGLRVGNVLALTVNQRVAQHTSLEFLMGEQLTQKVSFATAMVKQHQNVLIGRGINIYMGAGGQWSWKNKADTTISEIGAVLLAGAEVTFGRLNLSWDFRPLILFGDRDQNFYPETAFSFRYIFIKKDPFKKKKEPFWNKWFKKK